MWNSIKKLILGRINYSSYMKLLIKILLVISVLMIGFNVFQINWNAPNWNENIIALIGIISASCALFMILILMVSNKISKKNRK